MGDIRSGRSILTPGYATESLNAWRLFVRRGVGYIPVVSVSYFLDCIVPNYSSKEAEALQKELIKTGTITKKGIWYGFTTEPKDWNHTDMSVYRNLRSIFDCIIGKSPDAALQPVCTGATTPWSQRGNNSKPDGFLELRKRSPVLDHDNHAWGDIVQAWAFKKEDTEADRLDDFSKILWSGDHILCDPRRQWTTGLTIENISARMWYFDRSCVMVTQPFNFRVEHVPLIRFWRGIAFESLKNLGYDNTITLVGEANNDLQYDIRIRDETFRTVKLLFRADGIVGCGTRVWLVCSRDYPDKRCIIKDVWMHQGAKSETEIRKCLTDRIEANSIEMERTGDFELYRRYFLTHDSSLSGPVVTEGSGTPVITTQFVASRTLVDDEIKGSLSLLVTPSLKPDKHKHPGSQLDIDPSEMTETSVFSSWHLPKSMASQFEPRTHYREVFEEECEPYDRLTSVPEMCQTLYDCTKALQLLWKYDFVHRDVSTGNVLWDPKLRGGRLGDLEFMINVRDTSSDDAKTGTPQFMAVEICRRSPLVGPIRRYNFTMEAMDSHVAAASKASHNSGIPFHALHDIESIWWIAVWTLIKRIPESDHSTKTDVELAHQEHLADIVFPSGQPGDARHNIFVIEGKLLARTTNLNSMTSALAPYISGLRDYLYTQYARKGENEVAHDQFRDVHHVALQILEVLCIKAKKNPMSVVSLYSVVTRRQREKERKERQKEGQWGRVDGDAKPDSIPES